MLRAHERPKADGSEARRRSRDCRSRRREGPRRVHAGRRRRRVETIVATVRPVFGVAGRLVVWASGGPSGRLAAVRSTVGPMGRVCAANPPPHAGQASNPQTRPARRTATADSAGTAPMSLRSYREIVEHGTHRSRASSLALISLMRMTSRSRSGNEPTITPPTPRPCRPATGPRHSTRTPRGPPSAEANRRVAVRRPRPGGTATRPDIRP